MVFICPECGKEHSTQLNWRTHLNTVHQYADKSPADFNFKVVDDKHHECQVCLKWVPNGHETPAVLQYHRFNHLPYPKIYRCKHCRCSFLRKRSLTDHLYGSHEKLISKSCSGEHPYGFGIKATYRDPKLNKEFYIRFLCPLCGRIFERLQFWVQHLDAAHASTAVDFKLHRIAGSKSYYCSECSYTLKNGPTRSQMQRHHFSHLPYPQFFQCAFCYSRKAYKTEVLLHFIRYHTAEYLKNRRFVFMPDEWGGPPKENTVKEIKRLLEMASRKPTTDILQRALLDIDLEEESTKAEFPTAKKFNHEQALDDSLDGFESAFVAGMENSIFKSTGTKRGCVKFSDIEDDLEYIFQDMFEEIVEYSPSMQTDNASLHKDMQKYIHYLCPECGNEFNDQNTWRSHVYEQHNLINAVEAKFRPLNSIKTAYLCLVCHEVQRTSKHSDLRRHHFQHMPFQSYLKCSICSKTKSSKPKMIQHMEFIHQMHIKKEPIITQSVPLYLNNMKRTGFRCLECDKIYTVPARFRKHCSVCPRRLAPLPGSKTDIVRNQRLLEHLHKANKYIDQMLIDAQSSNKV